MRLAIAISVVLVAFDAAAQSCPAQQLSCPGTASIGCGSTCSGNVTFTRTASCNSNGAITSCVVRASTGQSCNCVGGSCSLGDIDCPCQNRCGAQCLDGQGDVTCCGGTVYQGQVTCCGDKGYPGEITCCDGDAYQGSVTCCPGGFACPSSLDCCQNGVEKCIEKGGSCCEDGVHGCPRGSDCVADHCCPRLTTESSPFTTYDGTTGYCCGDQSCVSTGQCVGGYGICACANPCNGSCCPSGTTCCPHKGWCAPDTQGCPVCPASHPVECGDGTCAPSGGVCCGGGRYCPNGLSCSDCGGGQKCCGTGPGAPMEMAPSTMGPTVSDAGAVPSTRGAMSMGTAGTNLEGGAGTVMGTTPGTTGCGGSPPGSSSPRLGTGFQCGCSGGGGLTELLALGAILRVLRARAARAATRDSARSG